MAAELTPEDYVVDFLTRGETSPLRLEAWEQAYQDAGVIEAAERMGYIRIGRDVACTIELTKRGRRIAEALSAPKPPRLFLWRGGEVLKNYAPGSAVVLAADEADAWTKLRAVDPGAYYQLKTGHRLSSLDETPADYDAAYRQEIEDGEPEVREGFPLLPTAYELEAAPVIVQWGGE